ncbi:hypothetical protein Pmar_PMAR024217 [Perkinsus marinus ATCC 50983]|uniref:tRNA/rRNA methyltransferase SpoU type domain-containing protein n=1 Tax=Perkinsus marinus (strain ATCC 50983 / TXsc) TaxID=423536 RepID=C5L1W4_PERM5|nr:hypothetical protein Pmar_PMAR024217 [Perkinsus marinus ATCC 50983]EER09280.1 hypothetical protein Pmar_PMAR024217 [Perkinsus marinus ATCC 50983]|eukprot:XP_002777464.1 hypothetical protein Pmar_PMAR024217 [Perkinsus marinus ATCC 50983]
MLGCGGLSRRRIASLGGPFLHCSVTSIVDSAVPPPHTLIMLDGVKYPGNAGNVLSNAGKLGCSAVLLGRSRRSSQPYQQDFALSALCSSSTVRRGGIPLVLNVHCVDTIHLLREEYAYRVILIENKEVAVDHGLPFIDLSCEASARAEISTPRVLFVGGGELEGVGPLIPKVADAILSIPTVFDHHHSYNVCTAMTLVMFERYRFTKTWPRPSMLPPLSDGELAALREQRVGTRGKDHDQF